MAQSPEQKLVKQVVEALDNHWFNPALFADIITTDYTVYTQNKLIELIKWIIRFEQRRFQYEWDTGMSSNELLQADALADVLNGMEPAIDTRKFVDSLPAAEKKEVDTSWVHRTHHGQEARIDTYGIV
jgi:hypothetical protein